MNASAISLASPGAANARVMVKDPGRLLEMLFSSATLFVATGAIFPLLRRPEGEGTFTVHSGGPEGIIYAIASVVACILLIRLRRELGAVVRQDPVLWMLPVLALLSTAWSTEPSQSLRGSVSLVGVMLFGAYIGLRFDGAELLRILNLAVTASLLLSIGLVFLEPSLGKESAIHEGAWHGIFAHKNLFGRVMVFALAVYVIQAWQQKDSRLLTIPLGVCAALMIWLSHSRTSMIAAAGVLALFMARPLLRRIRVGVWVVALGVFAGLAVLAVMTWNQRANLATGAGDSETFTGRTLLWAMVALKIYKHPLFGYGYSAFWSGPAGNYVDVWRAVKWNPPNAHDAFLDVALDLGFVGLVLFLSMIVRTLARALSLELRRDLPLVEQVWPSAFVTFTLLSFITEGDLMTKNFCWILLTAVSVLCSRRSAPFGASLRQVRDASRITV